MKHLNNSKIYLKMENSYNNINHNLDFNNIPLFQYSIPYISLLEYYIFLITNFPKESKY